ncbi:putrescine aminotransferase [Tumebacillus avium]|uniref:Putrescine aminotransferase n=1 Tax=Tumebacillus avium TaxID=1903704 RepID=A0A1Y0IVE3_9BACL|nr:aminotransferase class III-fold pyridoxal phosphate-dependent enzyme [Tumebacillus avium]ARU63363.1 putrescine aminotransferase [Tumebacillus avium]
MKDRVIEQYEQFINPGLARLLRVMGLAQVEDEARGSRVRDTDGTTYIDCVGGYGAYSFGHRNQRILEAVAAQLHRMPLASKVLLSKPMADLAEKLARITPGDLQYSFFCNSGAEAVEAALKLARLSTGRTKIVAAIGGFHGKTLGALSASGKDTYRDPFQPLLDGFLHVPFGDAELLRQLVDEQTAAVILEPVQGEAGVILPPPGYLQQVREICDAAGALLIADEVQTGLGRTGKKFAVEHEGVVPDILCLAKALGGGVMPIGAVVARPHLYEQYEAAPLLHTSTFGGNPLACAAANAALDVLESEKLEEQAAWKGEYLLTKLRGLQERYPGTIQEVRGIGLLIGLEFTSDALGGLILSEMISGGVLTAFALHNLSVTRIEPPLTIDQHEIDQVVSVLEAALQSGRQQLQIS